MSHKRHYPRTDETFDVLRACNIKNVAKEYSCDDSYIYAIKNGDTQDPYPHFRILYKSVADAGDDVDIWLDDLIGIKLKAQKGTKSFRDIAVALAEKIKTDAQSSSSLLDGLRDNSLDRRECREILAAFDANDRIEEEIKRIVRLRLAELGDEKPPER